MDRKVSLMRVSVSDKCSGHGRCYSLAPDVYQDDDVGFNVAIGTTFEVSSDLAEQARMGAVNCPEDAITIVASSLPNERVT
jgi:ferredoxin